MVGASCFFSFFLFQKSVAALRHVPSLAFPPNSLPSHRTTLSSSIHLHQRQARLAGDERDLNVAGLDLHPEALDAGALGAELTLMSPASSSASKSAAAAAAAAAASPSSSQAALLAAIGASASRSDPTGRKGAIAASGVRVDGPGKEGFEKAPPSDGGDDDTVRRAAAAAAAAGDS